MLPLPAARREAAESILDSSRHRSSPYSQSAALDTIDRTGLGDLSHLKDAADALTVHGVASRYPDDWRKVGAEEMNEIIELTRQLESLSQ